MNKKLSTTDGPIGIFDSGYGGLTILEEIRRIMPEYDYIYLGDNARTPYGTRSFDVVYQYTLECVTQLFEMGCQLVILACNTASAKALRSIQQNDLPLLDPDRRVLGVIRPTVEVLGDMTHTGHLGVLATPGTVLSNSYPLEIHKLYPDFVINSVACPMWVPLIENKEHLSRGADYFVELYINELMTKDDLIDAVILGCTHYPLLIPKIKQYLSANITIISQGEIVARSLKDYMLRHPGIDTKCSKGGDTVYYSTESVARFEESARLFLNEEIKAIHIKI